jgi:hypothetical protein
MHTKSEAQSDGDPTPGTHGHWTLGIALNPWTSSRASAKDIAKSFRTGHQHVRQVSEDGSLSTTKANEQK